MKLKSKQQIPVVQKVYLETTLDREGCNGRIYSSILGTRWIVFLHGEQIGDPVGYRTRREALAAAQHELDLKRAQK